MFVFEDSLRCWRHCSGRSASQEWRSHFAVSLAGEPDAEDVSAPAPQVASSDLRLWEEGPACCEEQLALEVHYHSVPVGAERGVADACLAAIEACLQERRADEFRSRLRRRQQELTLRRRKIGDGGGAEQLEMGDDGSDGWREFLHKPAEQSQVKALGTAELPSSTGKVLACRFSLPAADAEELGRLAFPHVFGEQRRRDGGVARSPEEEKLHEDRFLMGLYACGCFFSVLAILWLYLFLRAAIYGPPRPHPSVPHPSNQ